ncbi:MAG TPA: hypothetical protein VMW41_02120 [Candidatus Bathyarchaeia archaeon]|nr:hypothetical protein [Candidatus Bathyarchaeia archaeon]
MQLLLLPGNSFHNKEWIEAIKAVLEDNFDLVKIQYYHHWETGKGMIDFDFELEELVKTAEDLKDYLIFGKSAGVLLALRAIYEKKIVPRKCIFVGSAVWWGKGLGLPLDLWLKNLTVPALFIQKSYDPAIPFKELEKLLKVLKLKNFQLAEVPGNDHVYRELHQLKSIVLPFLNITSEYAEQA